MNRNVNAALNNTVKAGNQLRAANAQAAMGNVDNANRMVNAAAKNAANANNQFRNAANQARSLGLNNAAKNLNAAANAVKKAQIIKALKNAANAIKAMAPKGMIVSQTA
jgi:ribosomal protein S20